MKFICLIALLPIIAIADQLELDSNSPCERLPGSSIINNVDLVADVGNMQMSTITATRDTTLTLDLFNLGQDTYNLGACMNHNSYLRLRLTRLCPTIYQYSSAPQKIISVNIAGNGGFSPMTLNWNIAGSGNTPVCSMYFVEVEVDYSNQVAETNEQNNNTQKFCYHIKQGILTGIQPQSAKECVKSYGSKPGMIYAPKKSS